MTPLTIRPLDGPAEAEICARMMAESEPWLTLKRGVQAGLDTLLHPDKEVYVTTADGQIVGFIILNLHGALVGYLQTICISSEHRGGGVGGQLIAFAEARIFAVSPNVFLMVSSFNPGARRLYERLGYRVVGELNDYIIEGASELILRKTRGPLG